MPERLPTPSELTTYADVFFQILKESSSILDDASERRESQEVVNERVAQMMVALHADEASLRVVDDDSSKPGLEQVESARLKAENEWLRAELADALCETCQHPWRYHTTGGMCSGSAEYIECYCIRISPL